MGAGYAYWYDSITITNSVSTGELEVIFTPLNLCDVGSSGDYDNYPHYDIDSTQPFQVGGWDHVNEPNEPIATSISICGDNDIFNNRAFTSVDNKTLYFENSNLYPGSGAWVKFGIENIGTIPVVLDYIGQDITDGEALKDEFQYTISSIELIRADGLSPDNPICSGNFVCYTFDSFIAELTDRLTTDDDNAPIVLNPGDRLVINPCPDLPCLEIGGVGYDIYLKDNTTEFVEDEDGNPVRTEDASFNFNLTMNWKQFNDVNGSQ